MTHLVAAGNYARRLSRPVALGMGWMAWIFLMFCIANENHWHIAHSDWTSFAVGGRLILTQPAELYHHSAQLAEQLRLIHLRFPNHPGVQNGLLPVVAPPWVILFAAPFTALGFTLGGKAWVVVQVLALVFGGLCVSGLRNAQRALIALTGVPAVLMAMNGQVDGVVVFGLGLGWLLYSRGHRFWAGVALALALAKPHLVLGIIVALLVTGRWRMLTGWVAGGLALVAAVTAIEPHLVLAWVDYAFGSAGLIGRDLSLAGIADQLLGGRLGSLLATATALGVTLWLARGREPACAAAIVILGGLLAAPHALSYDLVLVPLALLIAGRDQLWRLAAISAGAFLAAAAGGGVTPDARLVASMAGSLLLLLVMVDVARPRFRLPVPALPGWRVWARRRDRTAVAAPQGGRQPGIPEPALTQQAGRPT